MDLRPGRVIDVRSLVGSTDQKNWPASPVIKPALVEAYEKEHGRLQPGDVVLFHTGHLDKHFRPRPERQRRLVRPAQRQERRLARGERAPTVVYLKKREFAASPPTPRIWEA